MQRLFFKLFHFKKALKQLIQSGRSMVEMLGILAIVGILSLAGLAAYAIAMTYYRANQTIHDVMLRASNVPMVYETYNTPNRPDEYNFVDLGNKNSINYAVETKSEPDGYAFLYRVVVSDVPEAVCKRIISMKPTDIDLIMVGTNASYFENNHPDSNTENASERDCIEENKTMAFYFGECDNCNNPPVPDACTKDTECASGCCVAGYCQEAPTYPACYTCLGHEWVKICDKTCQRCTENVCVDVTAEDLNCKGQAGHPDYDENKCECANPIRGADGELVCGPTYCPEGTTCMPLGTCCENEKVYGSENSKKCCDGDVYEPWEGASDYGESVCCDDGVVYDISDYEQGCCKSPDQVSDALGGGKACCKSGYTGINSWGYSECCPNGIENAYKEGFQCYSGTMCKGAKL